jgi:hypothetical protein
MTRFMIITNFEFIITHFIIQDFLINNIYAKLFCPLPVFNDVFEIWMIKNQKNKSIRYRNILVSNFKLMSYYLSLFYFIGEITICWILDFVYRIGLPTSLRLNIAHFSRASSKMILRQNKLFHSDRRYSHHHHQTTNPSFLKSWEATKNSKILYSISRNQAIF